VDVKYQEQFILEYFKELRTEINLRIKNHTALVTLKVMTIGALLAFLLKENTATFERLTSYSLLLVPAMAMLFDVMICQNIHTINQIGVYIRDNIEPGIDVIDLWESLVAQKAMKKRCYGWADAIVLGVLTLGTCGVVLFVLWKSTGTVGVPLWILTFAYVLVGIQMKKTILHFESPNGKKESGHNDVHPST
jgi:hypothetical protein